MVYFVMGNEGLMEQYEVSIELDDLRLSSPRLAIEPPYTDGGMTFIGKEEFSRLIHWLSEQVEMFNRREMSVFDSLNLKSRKVTLVNNYIGVWVLETPASEQKVGLGNVVEGIEKGLQ